MKRLLAAIACAGLVLASSVSAQTNDDDYTPLNSRIKRKNQFPLEPRRTFDIKKMSEVNKKRSKAMLGQFTRCLYNRSHEKSLDLLAKTDLGFVSFEQIGTDTNKAVRVFGFNDCLGRVASSNNSGLVLRFYAGGMRQWLLQQAYFDLYPDEPSWVKPGIVIEDRVLPLSGEDGYVTAVLDLADCVVAADPYGADYYFRTQSGSEEEKAVLKELVPSIGACLPEGQQMQIDPNALRVWLGESLWHAANHSVAGDADNTEVDE